jgi:hypothetical protein
VYRLEVRDARIKARSRSGRLVSLFFDTGPTIFLIRLKRFDFLSLRVSGEIALFDGKNFRIRRCFWEDS